MNYRKAFINFYRNQRNDDIEEAIVNFVLLLVAVGVVEENSSEVVDIMADLDSMIFGW